MNQSQTPEAVLSKANEYLKANEEENALSTIFEFLNISKKKSWTQNHQNLAITFIELAIKLHQPQSASLSRIQ